MSLEEIALEILHEEEELESVQVEMSPRSELDEHVSDHDDVEPEDDADDAKEIEDDDDVEDLVLLETCVRHSEPLKGKRYIKKHDDILELDHVQTLYWIQSSSSSS